ncbi:hypothetical protein HK100_012691 [Physocladia obscura]|uniref:Aminoglycoside phosphotransferase domain-containing protein n=1 Tax=Physocladia obscura TaxID=109957 RepID=A0AAD5SZG8_9FUNG|nr:hypothetical protein HK100_012691 [Physocladia obscura]
MKSLFPFSIFVEMATQNSKLPVHLTSEAIIDLVCSLGLPRPIAVKPLAAAAEFHAIYLLTFAKESTITTTTAETPHREPDGSTVLVLRVSGNHIPSAKTLNEVGIMTWLAKHTTIPVPRIIRYCASAQQSAINHEFTILEKATGVSIDRIYDTLNAENKKLLIHQLIHFLIQLSENAWPRRFVGGLVLLDNGTIQEGPLVDEHFWMATDIETYWVDHGIIETIESLNPIDSEFDGCTAYNTAALEKYIYAIERHPSLLAFKGMIPKMQKFIAAINSDTYKNALDDVKYILAHRDLHFGNIMCDPSDMRITAILDWEFGGVVAAPRWNVGNPFLWNAQNGPESKPEREKMMEIFEQMCIEQNAQFLLDETKPTFLQDAMQMAVNHIRAIVEVCPKGEAQDKIFAWRETAEASMDVFL